MSSTQDSDANFQSWFGSSRWKTAIYIGVPLLGVSIVGVYLWRRHSAENAKQPSQETQDNEIENVITPEPKLVWFCLVFII